MGKLRVRRVAAHEVIVGKEVFSPAVVELIRGKVVGYYLLTEELPQTEWLGGTILIEGDSAFWNGVKL